MKKLVLVDKFRWRYSFVMPGRNIYKQYAPETFYHVYNRGVNRQVIFRDDRDYTVFLSLFKRYLSAETPKKGNGVIYQNLRDKIELVSFCLMPNHFHALVYQHDARAIQQLFCRIGIAYSMYFNTRYRRIGPLFQQRYRAVMVENDSYLMHVSRYIHLNPNDYAQWKWSSFRYFTRSLSCDWVRPDRILGGFRGDYIKFVEEYRSERDLIKLIEAQYDLS